MISDPQVLDFIRRTEKSCPPEANAASAADNRRAYDIMCAAFRAPRPEGLTATDQTIGGVPCRT